METQVNEPKTIDFSIMGRAELEDYAMRKSNEVLVLEAKLKAYEEQLIRNRHFRFGPSAERYAHEGQISFFNEPEQESDPEAGEPEEADVTPPRRKKRKGQKKDVIKNLPKEVIEYVLSKEERVCPKCGDRLEEMKTAVRVEIEVIRPKYKLIEHRAHVYACRKCDKQGTEGTIITAPSPKGMFRNSLASPGLVADILFKKYALAQPLNRQSDELGRIGLNIQRNTIANWAIMGARRYLSPIREFMRGFLLTETAIHCDELCISLHNSSYVQRYVM